MCTLMMIIRQPRFEGDDDLSVNPDGVCYPDTVTGQSYNLMIDYKLPSINMTCRSLDRMITDPYWIDTFQLIGRREKENLGGRR